MFLVMYERTALQAHECNALTYLDGVQQTEGASLWVVEEGLPLVHGLQTVHQTAVETVRRGRYEPGRDRGQFQVIIGDCGELTEERAMR